MVDAATEFRKNGFNDEDSATLAQVATMFSNVSDEEISAADSASFIISQMIAFGIEAENASSIIDKVNETANSFSVSSGDLATALGIVASTSAAMGNSIDETLGIVTAITEQTRNASKSARTANTVFSRLAQITDESSETGQKLTEIYEGLDIALYDSTGQMRDTYDILSELASKWDGLDKNTQQYIAQVSAGTNQLNGFLALMNNFQHAADATATSMNSAGSATRENERYMEGLEAQTQSLKAEFQDFANNVITKEFVHGALKLANTALEKLNGTFGTSLAQVALISGSVAGAVSIVGTVITKLGIIVKASATTFSALASGGIAAAGGIGAVVSAAAPWLAVAAGVIALIAKLGNGYKTVSERLEETNNKLETDNDKLETNKKRIHELSATPWYDRSPEIASEIEQLEIENKELQDQIDKLLERKEILEGELSAEEPAAIGETVTETTASGVTHTYTLEEWEEYLDGIRSSSVEYANMTMAQIEAVLTKAGSTIVHNGEKTAHELTEKLSRGVSLTNEELVKYQELVSNLDKYKNEDGIIPLETIKNMTASEWQFVQALEAMQDAYEATAQKSRTYAEQVAYTKSKDAQNQAILNDAVAQGLTTQSEYNNMIKVYMDYGMSYSDALAAVAKQFKDAISALGGLNNVSVLANEAIQNLVKQLTNAQTAYNSFTEDGNLSIDTLVDIRDAFSDVTGIDTYIDRLGAAGNTADDVREILGQLVEAKVKATFSTKQLANSEATVVAKMLDDAGVANSLEVATHLIADAKVDLVKQNLTTEDSIDGVVASLDDETASSKLARAEIVNLVAQEQVFNNSSLDASQKIEELGKLATAAGLAGSALQFSSGFAKYASSAIKQGAKTGVVADLGALAEQYWNEQITGITDKISDAYGGATFKDKDKGGTSGGGSSKSKEDTKLTALKEAVELRKSELDLMDAQGASDTSRIEKIREIIKALQNQIDYMKKSGASQADINALIKEQLSYEDKIKDIYNEIIEAQKEALETRRDNLKSAFSTITDLAQDELDKIEELEDEINKKYDDKLDALEEANDALNEQIQLEEKLEALAKAKTTKKMVYSNGQFVYMDDIDSISAAQGELDALNREREQEQQKAEIEAQRKQELIANRIEERKKEWQDYIDTWGSIVDNYEKQQDKLLASQIFGINLEEQNWQKRIGNAKKFADEYANIMSQISTIENIQSAASASGGLTVDPSIDYSAKMLQAKSEDEFLYWSAYRDAKIQQTGSESKITSGKIRSNEQLYNDWKKVKGYSVGTYSSKSGLAMLGENGPELGVLKGGTGILPADITKNLWAWGSTTPAQMMYALDSVAGKNSGGVNMNNVVLEFPNVRDGNDAKDFVTNVVNLAYQKAYKRA